MSHNKSTKMKSVKLKSDTWKALKILQIELELFSLDDVIRHLLKFYYEHRKEASKE